MTREERPADLCLYGCRPTPLASYLKALGILRLVAEQADPHVKGSWRAERFWLRTTMTLEELTSFFLNDYAPSPIIAPWNGGSGFYPKDNQSGIGAIEASTTERFHAVKGAIEFGRCFLKDLGVTASPKDESKLSMISALRAKASDDLVEWIDAAVAVSTARLGFPPLLGTGGNDGRLDFTNNYFQRLCELFDQVTGAPNLSADLLASALVDSASEGVSDSAIGQFSPAVAGGANSTTGFKGDAAVNPWDYVFLLEGSLLIAGGIVRRLASEDRSAASFPFTVRSTGAGFGSASQSAEKDTRGEFWAPLWQAPSSVEEVRALFREGRIAQTMRPLRDGMDAALAIASIGADRRISGFQRFGFEQRQGLAFLATPLERRDVKRAPASDLATDLNSGAWLDRVRQAARGDRAPARLVSAVRMLEDSLFALASGNSATAAARGTISSTGRIARIIASSTALRQDLVPPPLLRHEWIRACGESVEVRLAAALSGLWLKGTPPEGTGMDEIPAARDDGDLPFRTHVAPLVPGNRRRRPNWTADGCSSAMVWAEGRLVDSLVGVALRRSIEATRAGVGGGAFSASWRRLARLDDIAAFLAGHVVDERVNDLALGFAWVAAADKTIVETPLSQQSADAARETLPLAYAALKPIFSSPPKKNDEARLPMKFPPAITPLLAAGRIGEALDVAMRRARADGLPTPFSELRPVGVDARRLLASLLFPISESDLKFCQNRAYPSEDKERPNDNAS